MSIDRDDWKVIVQALNLHAEAAWDREKAAVSKADHDAAVDAAVVKNRYRRIAELATTEMGRATR